MDVNERFEKLEKVLKRRENIFRMLYLNTSKGEGYEDLLGELVATNIAYRMVTDDSYLGYMYDTYCERSERN